VAKVQVGAVVLLGLVLGLWGIRWGLPGPERLARVLPPELDTPAFREGLAASWSAMHKDLGDNLMLNPKSFQSFNGVVETPAGWRTPPPELVNSFRSFFVRSEHEDEQSILLALSRMKPKRLEFRPHLFTYGALHIYSVGGALVVGAVTGLVSLKSSILFYLNDPAKMAAMYLAGRLLAVACFVGGALMLLRLGRRSLGAEAGVYGAAIYLMTPQAVVQAHVLKNHTFWTVFALLTVERSIRVLETGKLRDYALAGAVAGLATASFLGAWPACLIVGTAGFMRLLGLHAPKAKPVPPLPELKGLVFSGVCAAAAFLITNPYWIVDFKEALLEMRVLSGYGGFDATHPLLFVRHAFRRSVTDPVIVLIFGGAALALLKGKREPALLLCGLAFLLALACMATVVGVVSTRQARYFTGWVALGSLLAGRVLQDLRAMKGAPGKLGTATAAIVLVGLLCQGLSYSHNFALGEGTASTHFRAGEWIEKNIPAGATIGLTRYPQPSNSPFFRWDRYRLRFIEPQVAANLPEKLLPPYLALTMPDHDDRPWFGANLKRYELLASFPRGKLFSWIEIDPTSTTANPLIEVYGLKGRKS